jgi:hypothetical protein
MCNVGVTPAAHLGGLGLGAVKAAEQPPPALAVLARADHCGGTATGTRHVTARPPSALTRGSAMACKAMDASQVGGPTAATVCRTCAAVHWARSRTRRQHRRGPVLGPGLVVVGLRRRRRARLSALAVPGALQHTHGPHRVPVARQPGTLHQHSSTPAQLRKVRHAPRHQLLIPSSPSCCELAHPCPPTRGPRATRLRRVRHAQMLPRCADALRELVAPLGEGAIQQHAAVVDLRKSHAHAGACTSAHAPAAPDNLPLSFHIAPAAAPQTSFPPVGVFVTPPLDKPAPPRLIPPLQRSHVPHAPPLAEPRVTPPCPTCPSPLRRPTRSQSRAPRRTPPPQRRPAAPA